MSMNESDYLKEYEAREIANTLPNGANLRALKELAGIKPEKPISCGRISSHVGWYRGKWEIDICHCGHRFRVPVGKKGYYQCNCCADREEGY